jgi:hypothetical protein
MKAWAVLATASLGAVAIGCGGSSSAPGGPVALSALPARWAQVICDQNFKCASAADIMYQGATKSDCVMTNQQAWEFITSSVQDGQQKGRVAYDAALMGTCLSKLAAESCDEWVTGLAHPDECTSAFTGKVAAGGACQIDFECVGGTCEGVDDSGATPKDGACRTKVAAGAACVSGDKCAGDNYCDDTAMMCVAKKPGGAACTTSDECGNSCNTDTSKCSGYAGCAVAPVTPRSTLFSLAALGLVIAVGTRRRRR